MMPLRVPGPDVLGVGVDIVTPGRMARMHARRGDRLFARLFSRDELAYCRRSPRLLYQRLAARWAAKEALAKALGTGLSRGGWREIEVVHDQDGAPRLQLRGAFLRAARRVGVGGMYLSLSHCSESAVAVVVLTHAGQPGEREENAGSNRPGDGGG